MISYDPSYTRNPPTDKQIEKYEKAISKLSNLELLEDTIELAMGDDYDGCHTRHGTVVYRLLQDELYHRLEKIKFLPEDSGDE